MNHVITGRPLVADHAFWVGEPITPLPVTGAVSVTTPLFFFEPSGFVMRSRGNDFHPSVRAEVNDTKLSPYANWPETESIDLEFTGTAGIHIAGFFGGAWSETLHVPAGRYTVTAYRRSEPGVEDYCPFNEPGYLSSPTPAGYYGRAMESWLVQFVGPERRTPRRGFPG